LRLSAELDDPVSTVRVLHLLAWEASLAGERSRARDHLREALVLLQEGGHHTHRVDVLGEVAVALGESSPETAARLLGADDAGFAAAGMRRSVPAHDRIERLRAGLAARLGHDALRRRLAEGAGLSLDEAIDEALVSVSLPA
jgi:hypothetical protein